jgi:flagellar basal body-associated protein FliL
MHHYLAVFINYFFVMETSISSMGSPKQGKSMKSWIILIVVILVVAVGGYFAYNMMPKSPAVATGTETSAVKAEPAGTSDYHAVFLSSGQVYFGKYVGSKSGQYVELEDVYYLQAQQSLDKKSAEQTKLSLVKLGGELHGPTDKVYVNRDHVLMIEDLRTDSNVVKTIESSKQPTKTQ